MSSRKGGFVVVSIVAIALLAASPAVSPKSSPTAKPAATAAPAATAKPLATTAAPAAAPAAGFEAIFSEALLGALLTAAAPFEETMEQEIGMMGFTKTVQVKVLLTDPKVRVAKDGVHVTMNYRVTDPSGVLDASGIATPEMEIVAVPGKNIFEGRLVKSGVTLPGGIELPVEDLVEPIELPGLVSEEVDLGSKVVIADAKATEILFEDGKVRVKGTVAFRPKK